MRSDKNDEAVWTLYINPSLLSTKHCKGKKKSFPKRFSGLHTKQCAAQFEYEVSHSTVWLYVRNTKGFSPHNNNDTQRKKYVRKEPNAHIHTEESHSDKVVYLKARITMWN